ncbi:MAG: oligosaccharide flippase family protein [Prevotella sp.]|nr:oligosaccharide flippase family protein [Prevotella sp.]
MSIRFLANPFVRNAFKLSSSNALVYLLPIVVTPILSRIYSTEDFSEWGVFSSTFLIINSVIFLSYDNAIVKCEKEADIPVLFRLCLLLAMCNVILVFLIFKVGQHFHLSYFEAFPSLFLLILLLCIAPLVQLLYNVSNRYEAYSLMSYASIIQGAAQAVFRILCNGAKYFNGLIVGSFLAYLSVCLTYIYGLRHHLATIFMAKMKWQHLTDVMAKYKKFPLFDAPGMLLETAIGNMSLILLSLYFAKDVVGCYSMIYQLILLPIIIVGSAVSKVYYKDISVAGSLQDISTITKKVVKISFVLSLLPILLLGCGGDYVLTWFLGEKWEAAGTLALCMSAISVPIILSGSLLPIFRRLDRQGTKFFFDLLCFIFGIGGLYAACLLQIDVYRSVLIYALLYSFVRYILFCTIVHTVKMKYSKTEALLFWGSIVCCNALVFYRLLLRLN